MWKEFIKGCETRWHSSQYLKEDDATKRGDVEKNVEKEDAQNDFASEYMSSESETLNIVNELGGVDNYKHIRFRVQVIDALKGDVIFEKRMDANPSSRGEAMDKLAIEALEARLKAVKKIDEETLKFTNIVDMYATTTNTMRYLEKHF